MMKVVQDDSSSVKLCMDITMAWRRLCTGSQLSYVPAMENR